MDPDSNDDTAADHERFETELLAEEQDTARIATADINVETARHLVSDLIDGNVVTPVLDDQILVHEPSDDAFDSIT